MLLQVYKVSVVKEKAIKLIKNLPDDSSWDDIIYEIYVKKKIEIGLKASEEGKTLSHDEVKKRFAR